MVKDPDNPPPEDLEFDLYGVYGSVKGFSLFQYSFVFCNDERFSDCYPHDYISNKARTTYLDLLFLDHEINSFNTLPQKPIVTGERLLLSNELNYRYWFNFKSVFYYSDFGFIFEEKTLNNFIIRDKVETTVKTLGLISNSLIQNAFGALTIINSKVFSKYERVYMKLQQLIANVGGILKAISICTVVINKLFSSRIYYLSLINSIIDVKQHYLDRKLFGEKNVSIRNKTNLELNSNLINVDKFNISKIIKKENEGENYKNNNFVYKENYENLQNESRSPYNSKLGLALQNPKTSECPDENTLKRIQKNENSGENLHSLSIKTLQKENNLNLKWNHYFYPTFCINDKTENLSDFKGGLNMVYDKLDIVKLINKMDMLLKINEIMLTKEQNFIFQSLFCQDQDHLKNNEINDKIIMDLKKECHNIHIKKDKDKIDNFIVNKIQLD